MKLTVIKDDYVTKKQKEIGRASGRRYERVLSRFVARMSENGVEEEHQLTPELITIYATKTRETQANTSWETTGWIVKGFLEELEKNGSQRGLKNKIDIPKRERKPKTRLTELDIERRLEEDLFSRDTKPRDQAILMLHEVEGLSTKMIRELTVLDVDIFEGEIRLVSKKKFIKLKKKTKEVLTTYMQKRSRYGAEKEGVFVTINGRVMSVGLIHGVIKKATKK